MELGLLGQPVPHVGGLEAVYAAGATASYAVSTEPTPYVPVLDNVGAPLEVRFGLVAPRLVLVRFTARIIKGTDTNRLSFVVADNGVRTAPSPGITPTSGQLDVRWLSWSTLASNIQQVAFEAPLPLPTGPHAIQVWKSPVVGTSSTTWGDRHLVVEVLAG